MHCAWVGRRIDRYVEAGLGSLEGALLRFHLARCARCMKRYEGREVIGGLLANIARPRPSRNLEVRILSAISTEELRKSQPGLRWIRARVRLGNLVRPVAVPAVGGLLLALAMVPTLLSVFWMEPTAYANDVPVRFLAQPVFTAPVMTLPSPFPVSRDLIVLAYIDHRGGVYDYWVASDEPLDSRVRGQIANALLTSKFAPAQRLGQPILGQRVILFQRVDSQA